MFFFISIYIIKININVLRCDYKGYFNLWLIDDIYDKNKIIVF